MSLVATELQTVCLRYANVDGSDRHSEATLRATTHVGAATFAHPFLASTTIIHCRGLGLAVPSIGGPAPNRRIRCSTEVKYEFPNHRIAGSGGDFRLCKPDAIAAAVDGSGRARGRARGPLVAECHRLRDRRRAQLLDVPARA